MEWKGHCQTTPGQCAAPSPGSGIGSAAASRDWHRRHQRRACLRLHRQHLEVPMEPVLGSASASSPPTLSRAQRAHVRLSWEQRLKRNARETQAEQITLTLFGLPDRLATFLGLAGASNILGRQGSISSLTQLTGTKAPVSPSGPACFHVRQARFSHWCTCSGVTCNSWLTSSRV
jgi:hypothetical protein